jgi:hypothetical protein
LKKPAGSVRFRFYKPKSGKNEPNRNRKKPSQNQKNQAKTEKTEPNRFELVFALKNQTETGRFDPVWVRFRFFFLKFDLVTFFDKNRTEQKMITPIYFTGGHIL